MKKLNSTLMLSVSLIAIGTVLTATPSSARQCSGQQGREIRCIDYLGRVVDSSYCEQAQYAEILGDRPSCSKNCSYNCSPPSTGGNGGRPEGIDTNGDGYTDTGASIGDGVSNAGRQGGGRNGSADGNTGDGVGPGNGSGGGGGGGSSRVICTYFFLNGEISKDDYYADFEYTLKHIHPNTVKGYHFWAVPYVEKLYQGNNRLLETIIRPIAIHRARELSYQMGIRNKPDYLGKFFRLLIEPICFVLGNFIQESDYTKLYTKKYLSYAAKKYEAYRKKRNYIKKTTGTPLASFTIANV